MATASFDGMTILWDAVTGNRLARWEGRRTRRPALAFSPDGKRLAIDSPAGGVDLVAEATSARIVASASATVDLLVF